MASITLRGATNVTFGIPGTPVTFLYLEQVDQSNEPEFIADLKDQNGITIGKAYGPTDLKAEFNGVLQNGTPVTAGSVFVYNGNNYIVEKVTFTSKNNDYQRCSFSATSYAGIPNP